MDYTHGKFVWFEHASHRIAAARAFYAKLFGWTSDPIPMGGEPYHLILNAGHGIGGFRAAEPGAAARWIGYLSVPDVDQAYRAATAAGAKGVMAPVDYGGEGRAAALLDPTGAAFCIWKGANGDGPDVANGPDGVFIWNELWSSDIARALAFYRETFRYEVHTITMAGGQGDYHQLKANGIPRAGAAQSVDAKAKSLWLPYVKVADCDDACAKARALGAQLAFPPMDIPGIGRFGILIDPAGAPLAVMKPLPM